MTDWDSIKMRSRAAKTLPDTLGAPAPVVTTTPEGDSPLGDATTWMVEAKRLWFVPSGVETPIEFVSAQLARGQVADRQARRWRWALQVEIKLVADPPPDPNITDFILEWTFGTGLSSVVQNLNLTTLLIPASIISGWEPFADATTLRFFVHDLPLVSDVIGEAVSARLRIRGSGGENDGTVQVSARLAIQPESIA